MKPHHLNRASQYLPMLKGMLRRIKEIFKDPVRARIITPRSDKKYKASPSDPVYIRGQVPPDSLVFTTARKRANSPATGDTAPADKESKRIDGSLRTVEAQSANRWRIANSVGLLARYDRAHWDEMSMSRGNGDKNLFRRAKSYQTPPYVVP